MDALNYIDECTYSFQCIYTIYQYYIYIRTCYCLNFTRDGFFFQLFHCVTVMMPAEAEWTSVRECYMIYNYTSGDVIMIYL